MHFLADFTQSLKMNREPPLSNLETLFEAVCAPTGVLRML